MRLFADLKTFPYVDTSCLVANGSSRFAGWPKSPSSRVTRFAPLPLREFLRYYRVIRRLRTHSYFAFRVLALIAFQFALSSDFPSSISKPEAESCHLYAGPHSVGKQVASEFVPRRIHVLGSEVAYRCFDPSSVVHSHSTLCSIPDWLSQPFDQIVHHLSVTRSAASGGL